MTTTSDPITRKMHTREPGNPGEFGTHDHSAPESTLGQRAPQPIAFIISDDDEAWWQKLAEDTGTPEALLAQLAHSEREGIAAAAAINTSTPVASLRELAGHESTAVRESVAYNPQLPVEVLARLAVDEAFDVQSAVAQNRSTTADTLRRLYDADISRYEIARHSNAPADVIAQAEASPDSYVRGCVLHNPNATEEQFIRAAGDTDASVRAYAARHYKLTAVSVLDKLAEDSDAKVREAVCSNRHLSPFTLGNLCFDANDEVSGAANTAAKLRQQDEHWY